jgi:hypothetical protein
VLAMLLIMSADISSEILPVAARPEEFLSVALRNRPCFGSTDVLATTDEAPNYRYGFWPNVAQLCTDLVG